MIQKIRLIGLFVVLGALVAMLIISRAHHRPPTSFVPAETLEKGQKSKISIDLNKHQVTATDRKHGSVETRSLVGVRKAQVVVSTSGVVTVTAPQFGFINEPGVLYQPINNRLGIDVQWFYYRRWGVYTGATWSFFNRELSAVGAVGYTVSNTTVFLGYDLRDKLTVGVRVKL